MTEKGEHGATAIWTRAPGPGSCSSPARRSVSASTASISSTSSSGGRPPSEAPRSIEPREATRRTAELPRGLNLRLDEPAPAAREDVVVVEDGRAAGEHQLGQARARRGVLGLGVDPGPGRVELDEPLEQRRLLRPSARERLVEVVVGVDEARRDEGAAERYPLVRLGLLAGSHRGDEAVLDQDPAVGVLGARVVDREHVCAREQGLHGVVPYLCRVEVITPRSLDEALRAEGRAARRAPDCRRHRPARRAQLRPRPAGRDPQPGRGARAEGLVARERRAPARGRAHVHGGDAARARGAPARARGGVPHGRLAADPQPRHDRGQPRHRLAGRRRAPAAARREARRWRSGASAASARCR